MLRIDETTAWWTLVGACSGLFILMLDSTVVALALPSIRARRRRQRGRRCSG